MLLLGALSLAAAVPGSISRAQSAVGLALAFSEEAGTWTSDASGNANHGTLANGAAFTSSGRYGSAIGFDGIDDRVEVPISPSMSAATALTAEAWVYPTSDPPYGTIVRQPAATGDVYQLLVRGDRTFMARVAGASFSTRKAPTPSCQRLSPTTWVRVRQCWRLARI